MKKLATMMMLTLAACDPAEFRPAKGVKDSPSTKTAYRVKESTCDPIGFVIKAPSIEAVSETTANHGGTEFKVLDDFGHTTVETDFAATQTFGVVHGSATSREQKNHSYTAEAYRCR
jgi:hypothetical protein